MMWVKKEKVIFAGVIHICFSRSTSWDMRSNLGDAPVHNIHAHKAEINCVGFNPYTEWVVATGSGDKVSKTYEAKEKGGRRACPHLSTIYRLARYTTCGIQRESCMRSIVILQKSYNWLGHRIMKLFWLLLETIGGYWFGISQG